MSNVAKCVMRVKFLGQGGLDPLNMMLVFATRFLSTYRGMVKMRENEVVALQLDKENCELLVYDQKVAVLIHDTLTRTHSNVTYGDAASAEPLDLNEVESAVQAAAA